MVVHCTSRMTVQGSSAARVEHSLHRDCLWVPDTSSWGLSTNTFLYESHCLARLQCLMFGLSPVYTGQRSIVERPWVLKSDLTSSCVMCLKAYILLFRAHLCHL